VRILNNTPSAIFVSDIEVMIPPSSAGLKFIPDSTLTASKDIIGLLRGGHVRAFADGDDIKMANVDGKDKNVVPGTTLWPGDGKTISEIKIGVDDGEIPPEEAIERITTNKKMPKRFTIQKNVIHNVSIDTINVILTEFRKEITIDEKEFKNLEIQQAIRNGTLKLKHALEARINKKSGDVMWVECEPDKPEELSGSDLGDDPEYSETHAYWEGPLLDAGGYANMNRQYIINLNAMGLRVKPTRFDTSVDIELPFQEKIAKYSDVKVKPGSPKVFSTNAPSMHDGKIVSYTMMETEDKIHPNLARRLEIADEIWVPSEWNRQTFKAGGVEQDIKVMPLGIDSDRFKPRPPKIEFGFGVKRFVFLSMSTWLWRKGFDVLLKAYTRAFTADDDVTLLIFTRVPILGRNQITAMREDIKSWVGEDNQNLPNLVVMNNILPAEVMPYLYNSANCFSLFTRGEGWGLPYSEALASGVPVIGADHGGQQAFLNNDNSYLVKPDKVSGCHASMQHISPFYESMRFVDYSEKAIDEASHLMRYVYDHEEEAKLKAAKGREKFIEQFTWKKSARRVGERLRDMNG